MAINILNAVATCIMKTIIQLINENHSTLNWNEKATTDANYTEYWQSGKL